MKHFELVIVSIVDPVLQISNQIGQFLCSFKPDKIPSKLRLFCKSMIGKIYTSMFQRKCVKAVFKQTIALNMTLIDFPEDMWKDTEEILKRLEKK